MNPPNLEGLPFARRLVNAGIPVFVAKRAKDGETGHSNTGFWLPKGWHQTVPNLTVIEEWTPGDALCAVMGHVVDCIDIDTHKGGMSSLLELDAAGLIPDVIAAANTPSGGMHLLVESLNVRSRDNLRPGVDLKAGAADGSGRGFIYIAPTLKTSKVTGLPASYRWESYFPERLAQQEANARLPFPSLGGLDHGPVRTVSAAALNLAEFVGRVRGGAKTSTSTPVLSEADLSEAEALRVKEYCTSLIEHWETVLNTAVHWPDGQTDELGRGWERLVTDFAYELARISITPGSGISTASGLDLLNRLVPEPIASLVPVAPKWTHKANQILSGLEPVYIPPRVLHRPELSGIEAGPGGSVSAVSAVSSPETGNNAVFGEFSDSVSGESAVGESVPAPSLPPELPCLPDVFDPHGVLHPRDLAAEALAASHPRHRYSVTERCWYVREDGLDAGADGKLGRGLWRWRPMGDSAHEWARHILHELERRMPAGDKEGNAASQAQFARRELLSGSGTRGSIAQLIRDAAPSERTGSFRTETLDSNRRILWAGGWPWDLRCPGGKLAVAGGVDLLEVHEHSATVLPDAAVLTPKWDHLLAAMFPAESMRTFATHMLGASITGESDRILGFLYGPKGHAKTTLLELVAQILGTYAAPVDPALLGANDSTSMAFARMELRGLRLAFVDEGRTDSSRGFERLKALVGAQTMRGARKGKDSITFDCTHTLWITDNRDPALSDPALADRVRALSVANGDRAEISEAVTKIKRDTKGWIREEGPGVLAQLMLAAGRYLADRTVCDNPPAVTEMLSHLKRDQDTFLLWLDNRTAPGGWTGWTDLWQDYRLYAERMGVTRGLIGSATTFRNRLNENDIASRRIRSGMERNIVLRRDDGYGPSAWDQDTPGADE